MQKEIEGKWVTINGAHVLIKDGQSVDDALKERQIAKNNEDAKKLNENNKQEDEEKQIVFKEYRREDNNYEERLKNIDKIVSKIISEDGAVLVGSEKDETYYVITRNLDSTTNKKKPYRITEFLKNEPQGHQNGASIGKLTENYFVSHKEIRRIR